jgi:hypothetical protein
MYSTIVFIDHEPYIAFYDSIISKTKRLCIYTDIDLTDKIKGSTINGFVTTVNNYTFVIDEMKFMPKINDSVALMSCTFTSVGKRSMHDTSIRQSILLSKFDAAFKNIIDPTSKTLIIANMPTDEMLVTPPALCNLIKEHKQKLLTTNAITSKLSIDDNLFTVSLTSKQIQQIFENCSNMFLSTEQLLSIILVRSEQLAQQHDTVLLNILTEYKRRLN